MDDQEIVRLYWERSEKAISETDIKYGRLVKHLADNILGNHEDVLECVNDTYLGTWNSIPQERPVRFMAYICRITRNLALKKYEHRKAKKRNDSVASSLEELAEIADSKGSAEDVYEAKYLGKLISSFLRQLPETQCNLFVRRYWYYDSVKDLSVLFGISESKVKTDLFRTRNKLREYLEREGVMV